MAYSTLLRQHFGAESVKLKKSSDVVMKVASHFTSRNQTFVKQMFKEAQPECDICQRRGWRSRSRVWAFANLGIEIWVYRDYAKNITVYFIHRLRIMNLMTCIILGPSSITFPFSINAAKYSFITLMAGLWSTEYEIPFHCQSSLSGIWNQLN